MTTKPALAAAFILTASASGVLAQASAEPSGGAAPRTIPIAEPVSAAPDLRGQRLARLEQAVPRWLSAEFGYPETELAPAIEFVSARDLARLRLRDVAGDRSAKADDDLIAIYDDETRTIYLLDGWNGDSPADESVVVHEWVHHLQNMTHAVFACEAEREDAAYAAQERWLQSSGHSLEADFQLDPFTVLARTLCIY